MNCTPRYVKKQARYRCLSLILVIGLLFQLLLPLPGQEIWDETIQLRRRARLRLCHHRCHHRITRMLLLIRRGKVLLCRLGLVAILLVWSEWPRGQPLAWGLLSLPVIDFLLSLLPFCWPSVSQM